MKREWLNTKWSIVVQNFAVQFLTIFQGLLIARLLGPEQRGVLAIVVLWPNLVGNLANFGTRTSLTIAASSNHSNIFRIGRTSAMLTSCFGIILLFAYLCVFQFVLFEEYWIEISLYSINIIITHFASNYLSIILGMRVYNIYNKWRLMLNPIIIFLLVGIALFYEVTVASILFVFTVSNFIVLVVRIIETKRLDLNTRGNELSYSSFLKKTGSIGWLELSTQLSNEIDKVLIVGLQSLSSVGVFTVASSVSSLTNSLANGIGTHIIVTQNSRTGLKNLFVEVKHFLLLSLGVGSILYLSLDFIIRNFYGYDYAEVITIFPVLFISQVIFSISILIEQSVKSRGLSAKLARPKSLIVLVILALVSVTNREYDIVFLSFVMLVLNSIKLIINYIPLINLNK